MQQKKLELAGIIFWASLAFGIFLVGGLFAKRAWQPYQMFEDGYKATKLLIHESKRTRPGILLKRRHKGDGVTLHDAARAYPGVTLMQGWFTEGLELRLVDMEGKLIHRWPADFFSIWPDPSHVFPASEVPASRLDYDIHGMWLLPDGSVVFNFSELGTVKLDKCGAVQWTLDRATHHSITPNPDGSFWIPAKNDPRKVPDDLRLFRFSEKEFRVSGREYEDLLLLVNANGQVRKEISVLQALVDGGFEHQLYDVGIISKQDPTHLNDIEVVTPALAKRISGVNEGDLLVSLRQMHMLTIMDRETGRIKWHITGPWVRQHDPDITEEGIIDLFNNNPNVYENHESVHSDQKPGSNLVSLDPSNGQTSIIYPHPDQDGFFTFIQGTHQLLGNGNRLINESLAGRVFEVDKKGDIVWNYVKPYDDQYSSWIEAAHRYDMDYLEVNDWSCP